MSTDEPRATIRLLWDDSTSAGGTQRTKLSRPLIVATAIALADEAGVDGDEHLSMRRLGDQLGVSAMAVYSYVARKSQLLALMRDQVHAELTASHRHGYDRLTTLVDARLDLALRHPWTIRGRTPQPITGPAEQRAFEWLLESIAERGVAPELVVTVAATAAALVRDFAWSIVELRASADGDQAGAAWWRERTEAMAAVVPDFAERFPAFSRFGAAAEGEPHGRRAAGRDDVEAAFRRRMHEALALVVSGALAA